ncbi:MAG: hypothetical protein ACT4P0_10405 [Panacagrimonas sp.]
MLRRKSAAFAPGGLRPVRFGPFLFDPAARSLNRDGTPLGLTSAEFDRLAVLIRHAGPPPAPGLPRLLRRFHRALEEKLGEPVDLRLQTTPGRRLWVRRAGASGWTLLPTDAFDPRWPLPGALLCLAERQGAGLRLEGSALGGLRVVLELRAA